MKHDPMCPMTTPDGYLCCCNLIARVREDERANLYTMGQLADRCEESYEEGRKEGYARGLIEGDHGGRREGYRSGYAAGKDAVMTDSYAQAVAEGQRDEREACIALVETVAQSGAYIDYVEIDSVIAAIRARSFTTSW